MIQFSVLISVYHKDNPKYFEESLNSLINQSIIPSEIVIVLDGLLGDDLNKILSGFQQEHESKVKIKVLQLPLNLGLASALNHGLELCEFDWIARMDSDDICVENRFEIMSEFILNNPGIDVIGSQIIEFSNNSTEVFNRKVYLSHDEILKDMKFRCPMNHVSVFYKKSSVFKVGLYSLGLLEDYDLWIRMAYSGFIFRNLPEYLVRVRVDENFVSRRRGFKYFLGELRIQTTMKKFKIINFYQFFFNFFKRCLVRLAPGFILKRIYIFSRR
jgi:glycosyltransferase involved in cell wall biosynthesis